MIRFKDTLKYDEYLISIIQFKDILKSIYGYPKIGLYFRILIIYLKIS